MDINADRLVVDNTERYTAITSLHPRGRTLTIETEVGKYGEDGRIKRVKDHSQIGTFSKDDATVVTTRATLIVPKTGLSALLYMERSAGQSGATPILDQFQQAFSKIYRNHRLETETVVESEAWLEHAQLTKISAHVQGFSTDIADDEQISSVVGNLVHTLVPERGAKFLPRPLWEKLRDRKIKRSKVLGFPDDQEPDYVDVTLQSNGRTKTFELGREKRPPISYIVSKAQEEVRSLNSIRDFCLTEAVDHFERFDVEWSEGDAAGEWSRENLTQRMVANEQQVQRPTGDT